MVKDRKCEVELTKEEQMSKFGIGEQIIIFVDESPEERLLFRGKVASIKTKKHGNACWNSYYVEGDSDLIAEAYCWKYSKENWKRAQKLFKKMKNALKVMDESFQAMINLLKDPEEKVL